MITLYGIPNCNTIKKAREWLADHNIEYHFHDYKKEGITAEKLKTWIKEFGVEVVVNKKGTTWRKLITENPEQKLTAVSALKLMKENPSLIKRPVLETDTKAIIGFDEEAYQTFFKSKK